MTDNLIYMFHPYSVLGPKNVNVRECILKILHVYVSITMVMMVNEKVVTGYMMFLQFSYGSIHLYVIKFIHAIKTKAPI